MAASAFQLAVDDDLIMKNPFGFEMGTVIQNDSKKREAITTEEKENRMRLLKKKSKVMIYDKENKKPVIKSSICNGEQIAVIPLTYLQIALVLSFVLCVV